MIYTSHYSGRQIGKSISISLRPPKGCSSFDPLPLFAPSEGLLKFWKSSDKDDAAQQKYSEIFREEMAIKDQFIDLWLGRIKEDLTLNCYEKSGEFCHRYIVGEIIKSKKPELWGGEVSELNRERGMGNGELIIATSQLSIDSRPTKLISEMTWGEILDNKITAVFENKPPLPEVAVIKPWEVNLNQYALYGGDVVKIVGGDRKGEWQLERPPEVNPTHDLPNHKQWVKTASLTQPPKGHETWTDADFKKARKAS
jgi:uncharacterized protein YeaO (DUF488 family)